MVNNLHINQLSLTLPAVLGARRHSIARLLRAELGKRRWPQARWQQLAAIELRLSCVQTNLAIARALATAMEAAVTARHCAEVNGASAPRKMS